MRVASDVLGDLKNTYVDKSIVEKLDKHKALEDLDVLKLIGGIFSAGYMAKRKHLNLADPFNAHNAEDKTEKVNRYSDLSSLMLSEALNEEYAKSQMLNESVWGNVEFQKALIEAAKRWAKANSNRKVKLEF